MKTAVQEVFSELEKLHPNLFNVYTTEGKEFINHFHKYLELEKQQMWEYIKNYYVNGENSLLFHKNEFEQYYNETYKNSEQ